MVTLLDSAVALPAGILPAADPGPTPEPVRYVDPQIVGPGFIGFVIFVALAVAVFFLWRSMNRQLSRIDFEDPTDTRPVNAPFTVADRADAKAASSAGSRPAAGKGPGGL